jgi:hypothetical protein
MASALLSAADRRPAYVAFLALCSLLLGGCTLTTRMWQPDHRSGTERVELSPVETEASLRESLLLFRTRVPGTVVTTAKRDGERRTYQVGQPIALAFRNLTTAWILDQARAHESSLPLQASLSILLTASVPRGTFHLRASGNPRPWLEPGAADADPDAGALPLADHPLLHHSLKKGLGFVAELPATSSPTRAPCRLEPIGWRSGSGAVSREIAPLIAAMSLADGQKRLSHTDDVSLLFRAVSSRSGRQPRPSTTCSIPLNRLWLIGALRELDDLPLATAAPHELDEGTGILPAWFSRRSALGYERKAPKYELVKTAGRVLATPVTAAVDLVCWSAVIVTAPVWYPFTSAEPP